MKTKGIVSPGAMNHLGEGYVPDQENQFLRELAAVKKQKTQVEVREAQLGLRTSHLEKKYGFRTDFDRSGREITPTERYELMRRAIRQRCRYRDPSGILRKLRLPRVGLFDSKTNKRIRWVKRLTAGEKDPPGTYRAKVELTGEAVALHYAAYCLAPWVSQGLLAACDAGRYDLAKLYIGYIVAGFIQFFEKVTGLQIVTVPVHPKDLAFHLQPNFVCINSKHEKIGTFDFPNLGPALLGVARLRDFGMTPEEIDKVTGREGSVQGLDHFIERRGGPGGAKLVDFQVQQFLDAESERLVRTPELAELAPFFEKGREAYRRMKAADLKVAEKVAQEMTEAAERHAEAELNRVLADVESDGDADEAKRRKEKAEHDREREKARKESALKVAAEAMRREEEVAANLARTQRALAETQVEKKKGAEELAKMRSIADASEKDLHDLKLVSGRVLDLTLNLMLAKIGQGHGDFPESLQGHLVLKESKAGRYFVLSNGTKGFLRDIQSGSEPVVTSLAKSVLDADEKAVRELNKGMDYSLGIKALERLHCLVNARVKEFSSSDLRWLGPKVLEAAIADAGNEQVSLSKLVTDQGGLQEAKIFVKLHDGLLEKALGNDQLESALFRDIPFDRFNGQIDFVPKNQLSQTKTSGKELNKPSDLAI